MFARGADGTGAPRNANGPASRARLNRLRGVRAGLLRVDDDRLDRRRDAVADPDDDLVGADVADRLLEVDVAAVDVEPAGVLDRVGDVLRGDRAEQAAVVAGLLRDR